MSRASEKARREQYRAEQRANDEYKAAIAFYRKVIRADGATPEEIEAARRSWDLAYEEFHAVIAKRKAL